MASSRLPLIGITLGDPGGIGPEVVAKSLLRPAIRRLARFCLVAEGWQPRPSYLPSSHAPLDGPATNRFCYGVLGSHIRNQVSLSEALPRRNLVSHKPMAASGQAAVQSLLKAIDLAKAGDIDAIATAPISKEAVKMAGYPWPGHTEILADRTGTTQPVMTMVGGGLIVALVTTHVAIADLPKRITRERVLTTIQVLNDSLIRYWGIQRPRIGVCGLNPHAGESGQFGNEEIKAIIPAADQARKAGIACVGPVPADVLYYQAHHEQYDGIVAMYHDQANIPVKMLGFDSGVNVTLGLPIIRTSPDHGTAFDIAGKGLANPGSMIAAVKLAVQMARKRSSPH